VDNSTLSPPEADARENGRSVEGNARLTVNAAAVLLVLFAIEVATVVITPRTVLTLHVVVGLVLVPPLLVKISSVAWRFLQYYRGDEMYRRKGAPRPALRVLGPFLLLATGALVASGITLLLSPSSFGGNLRRIHSITFLLWFLLVLAHVALHWRDVGRLAVKDWVRRSRDAVPGAVLRQSVVLISLAVGLVLALSLVSNVSTYKHEVRHPAPVGQPAP
jgi:hypothetical protein